MTAGTFAEELRGLRERLEEATRPEFYTVPAKVLDGFIDGAVARERQLEARIQEWEDIWNAVRGLVEDSGEVTMSRDATSDVWEVCKGRAVRLLPDLEEEIGG